MAMRTSASEGVLPLGLSSPSPSSPGSPRSPCSPRDVPWGPGCPREVALAWVPDGALDISWANGKRRVPFHNGALMPPTKLEKLQGMSTIPGLVLSMEMGGGRKHFERSRMTRSQSEGPDAMSRLREADWVGERRHFPSVANARAEVSPEYDRKCLARQETDVARERLLVGRVSPGRSRAPEHVPPPTRAEARAAKKAMLAAALADGHRLAGTPLHADLTKVMMNMPRKRSMNLDDDVSTAYSQTPASTPWGGMTPVSMAWDGMSPASTAFGGMTPSGMPFGGMMTPASTGANSVVGSARVVLNGDDTVLSRSLATVKLLQAVGEKIEADAGAGGGLMAAADARRAMLKSEREQLDIAWNEVCRNLGLPTEAQGRRRRVE